MARIRVVTPARALTPAITLLLALAGLRSARAAAPVRTDFPAGTDPVAVAVADLNADGRPDLVVVNGSSNTVSILLGTATGWAPPLRYATGNSPAAVAVGDVTGDGIPDLVVANVGATTVSVLAGVGDGTFVARPDVNVGGAPSGIVLGDWNGDGKLDLAVTLPAWNTVAVMKGNGAGGFTARQTFGIGGGPQAIAAGDLDGDGHPDLVVAQSTLNAVYVLTGSATGTFDYFDTFPCAASPVAVTLADLDGDGHLDAVVACSGANAISVLKGTGEGDFSNHADFSAGTAPTSLALADFDGDHRTDAIVTNPAAGTVTELYGDGHGAFTAGLAAVMGAGCTGVTAANLNGDSLADFVTANARAGTVCVCVGGGAASVLLTASPNPVYPFELVTLTATVAPLGSVGTVTFYDSTNVLATAPVANGLATAGVRTLGAGSHPLVATWTGGTSGSVTSPTVRELILGNGPVGTTTSITVGPATSVYGQPVFVTATVSPPTATGSVNVDDATSIIGSGQLASGTALITISGLGVGDHVLHCAYAGDANDISSQSATTTVTVTRASSSVTVSSSASPSLGGATVGFTARVSPVAPSSAVPDGSVQFAVDGASFGGPVVLVSGVASSNLTAALGLGPHTVQAVYAGSATFTGATSPVITQVVLQAGTTTTLEVGVNPLPPGGTAQLQAFVAPVAPFGGVPNGSVQFLVDGVATGAPAALVSGGTAWVSIPGLPPGVHPVQAAYAGSLGYRASVSASQSLTVLEYRPLIRSVADVRADQGRLVRIVVSPSALDAAGSATPIVRYSVFRRADAAPIAAPGPVGPAQAVLAGWDQVAAFDAYQDSVYSVLAPTLADSSALGTHWSTYRVRAATASPGAYFDSPPDSGYFVDNLPPSSPAPFTAERAPNATHLHWGANAEPDFATYRLYRGADADFVPGPGNLVVQQPDTGYVDVTSAASAYKLAAVDLNGGESPFAVLTPDEQWTPPTAPAFALDAVSPNPCAGPGLVVHFALPSSAPARLELLDIGGRRVASLDAGAMGAGRHAADLLAGASPRAGLYFVRLAQGGERRTARVVLVR